MFTGSIAHAYVMVNYLNHGQWWFHLVLERWGGWCPFLPSRNNTCYNIWHDMGIPVKICMQCHPPWIHDFWISNNGRIQDGHLEVLYQSFRNALFWPILCLRIKLCQRPSSYAKSGVPYGEKHIPMLEHDHLLGAFVMTMCLAICSGRNRGTLYFKDYSISQRRKKTLIDTVCIFISISHISRKQLSCKLVSSSHMLSQQSLAPWQMTNRQSSFATNHQCKWYTFW